MIRKITAASAKTNTAPKARFVTAEQLLARDIRNEATSPNRSARRAATRMTIRVYQSLVLAMLHVTCFVPAQLAEALRVEKRKSPVPSPDEAFTLPLKVKSTAADA